MRSGSTSSLIKYQQAPEKQWKYFLFFVTFLHMAAHCFNQLKKYQTTLKMMPSLLGIENFSALGYICKKNSNTMTFSKTYRNFRFLNISSMRQSYTSRK